MKKIAEKAKETNWTLDDSEAVFLDVCAPGGRILFRPEHHIPRQKLDVYSAEDVYNPNISCTIYPSECPQR